MKRIYVAGPYTNPCNSHNTRKAILAGDQLWEAGVMPIVPHLTHLWDVVSPKPYAEWLKYDLELLKMCDALVRLPGDSSGADNEIVEAVALGIPVFYSIEAAIKWAHFAKA